MKYRLGASISSLHAGATGGRICKSLSFNPKFGSIHDKVTINRNLLSGFECLRRSLYSSVPEEDEFSELGPAVAQGRGKMPKLMTEKREYYQNKRALAGRSSYAESHSSVKNVIQRLLSPLSDLCPKPEKNDVRRLRNNSEFSPALPPKPEKIDVPRLSSDSECAPSTCLKSEKNDIHALLTDNECAYLNNVNSITIESVPTTLDIIQLMQGISKYGKISSASMRTLPDGLRCCDIEFENISSSQEALKVGWISIRKNKMRILPLRLNVQETCAIRINGISKETTDPAIHAWCKEIGPLEGLIKAGRDVDAIFSLKNDPDIQGILTKLNNTSVDNCQWSAYLLPTTSTPGVVKLKRDDAKTKLGSEIDKCLSDVKTQVFLKRIHVEDIQLLHSMITHLEENDPICRQ